MTVDRQFPRFAIDAQIVIRGTDGAELTSGRTTNLSRGGLCAEVGVKLDGGTRVDAHIALVFAAGSVSEPLTLPARVVWCTALGTIHQAGLAFLPLTNQHLHYLDMFIRFLSGSDDDGGPAERPPGLRRRGFDD